jgi:hypothetical protein
MECEKMWHAYRYLIAGRPMWDVAWFDLERQPDPKGWLEEKLGPLAGFERIENFRSFTTQEVVLGAHLRELPPEKPAFPTRKSAQRRVKMAH